MDAGQLTVNIFITVSINEIINRYSKTIIVKTKASKLDLEALHAK